MTKKLDEENVENNVENDVGRKKVARISAFFLVIFVIGLFLSGTTIGTICMIVGLLFILVTAIGIFINS